MVKWSPVTISLANPHQSHPFTAEAGAKGVSLMDPELIPLDNIILTHSSMRGLSQVKH